MTHCFHTYVCRIYVFAFRVCIRALKNRDFLPSKYASNPLLVHQTSVLLLASFRPLVTKMPLPSHYSFPHTGRIGGLAPPAVRPAGRTPKKGIHLMVNSLFSILSPIYSTTLIHCFSEQYGRIPPIVILDSKHARNSINCWSRQPWR